MLQLGHIESPVIILGFQKIALTTTCNTAFRKNLLQITKIVQAQTRHFSCMKQVPKTTEFNQSPLFPDEQMMNTRLVLITTGCTGYLI